MSEISSSTPSFSEFDPSHIPYQDRVVDDIYNHFDYSLGTHEVLLSGSVGSAKSILMAHLIVRHCLENPGARFLIGRNSLGDLRDTLFTKICEHLVDEHLVENVDYRPYYRECRIIFLKTGSEIIGRSWADKKFKKMRSLELSGACIEELTENGDQEVYNEIKMRVGRLPHIQKNLIICATNPDSPAHWAYQHFIEPIKKGNKLPTRHVYYSVTTDNPFLPSWYIEQLRNELDPKMARRMIFGEWIEIDQDVIYHSYKSETNFRNYKYQVNKKWPILQCHDFNIGKGKPMSTVYGQYDPEKDEYHWFAHCIVHGSRTSDIMQEAADRGLLDYDVPYEIYGDATGDHRDTRSLFTDYDIITKFMSSYKNPQGHFVKFVRNVPLSNPSVRSRHNIVNAYCLNDLGKSRFFVYAGCDMLDKGMRLSCLKDGGQYIEDDSPEYQHCTTAVGYCIVYKKNTDNLMKVGKY